MLTCLQDQKAQKQPEYPYLRRNSSRKMHILASIDVSSLPSLTMEDSSTSGRVTSMSASLGCRLMNCSISLASALSMHLTAMLLLCLVNSGYSWGMRKEVGQQGLPLRAQCSLSLLVRLQLPLTWLQYCPPLSLPWSPSLSMLDHSRLGSASACLVLYAQPMRCRLFLRQRSMLFLSSRNLMRLGGPSALVYSLLITQMVLFIFYILWRWRQWPCVSMRGCRLYVAVCMLSLSSACGL